MLLVVSCCVVFANIGITHQEKNKETDEFLRWLSPSYWLVEAQLYHVQTHREKETLKWAYSLREFRDWRNSDLDAQSKERILWIRGSLGVGKSIMAGYFIDLLTHLYPTPNVGYFFCKKGQQGLTRSFDIIRTLAYQLSKDNKAARSVLDELKRSDAFKIDDKLGVAYVFRKLLYEPLHQHTDMNVYIIVDGIDEADFAIQDSVEDKSEMEVLINCFAGLEFVRLLFISRPIAALDRLRNKTAKIIEKNDNKTDIDAYVTRVIEQSKTLKADFEREGVNPYEYFSTKADSIFLWVVIVLEQLERAKTEGAFRKYLKGFSEASGKMELLYTSVLSTFDEEERQWIKEILKWLVVAAEELTVEQLKEAVESSVPDKLRDFKGFLEVECGAILRLVPSERRGDDQSAVQLIHETLRSYLIDPSCCHKYFHFDEEEVHCEVVQFCLRTLCSGSNSYTAGYAAIRWSYHLTKVDMSKPNQILTDLYEFIHSDGCKTWLKIKLMRPQGYLLSNSDGRFVYVEEGSLQDVYECLLRWKIFANHDGQKGLPEVVANWVSAILETPSKLEEEVGKAAAELWLYEHAPGAVIQPSFWLCLKHYCKLMKRRMDCVRDLQDIATNQFSCLVAWVDGRSRKPTNMALGIAFYSLRLWDDSLQYLKLVIDAEDEGLQRWRFLGTAYLEIMDYDSAIEAFRLYTENFTGELSYLFLSLENLASALIAKGDLEGGILALEKRLSYWYGCDDLLPSMRLAETYASTRDYEKMIQVFEKAAAGIQFYGSTVYRKPQKWWAWQGIVETYKVKGDSAAVVEAYKKATEEGHANWARTGWRNATLENRQHLPNTGKNSFPSVSNND